MHNAETLDSIQKTLNINIIIVIVFFIALSVSARNRWLTLRELITAGVVLTISSTMLILGPVLKIVVSAYGNAQKAILMSIGYTAALVIPLVICLVIIVRKYKSLPPLEPAKQSVGKASSKKSQGVSQAEEPKPKPIRGHGKKKRF
jgi:hypothetical protein